MSTVDLCWLKLRCVCKWIPSGDRCNGYGLESTIPSILADAPNAVWAITFQPDIGPQDSKTLMDSSTGNRVLAEQAAAVDPRRLGKDPHHP